MSTGAAFCWGRDSTGELGNGATTNSSVPVPVRGGTPFASLSAGRNHTCAASIAGQAYCWGSNRFRQLGVGSQNDFYGATPIAVSGGHVFASIIAAGGHTCGLTPTGTGYCWGFDGLDAFAHQGGESATPLDIENGPNFKTLSAGGGHTCALAITGVAFCWGYNGSNQLGYVTPGADRSIMPRAVAGGLTFASLSAGNDYTCGVVTSGAAYCWGANTHGELGNGTRTAVAIPSAVAGHLVFAIVAAGPNFYIGNDSRQIGRAELGPGSHTCGVTTTGAAYCWGDNSAGQLGDGTHTNSAIPVVVAGGLIFKTITTGALHTCGVTTAGFVHCWGSNRYGQIGDGTTSDHAVPTLVKVP